MRVRSLFFAFPLLLAGCGGGSGFNNSSSDCTTDVAYKPRPYYVGSFQAVFTPSSGTPGATSFTFAVASDGAVTGSAVDAASNTTAVTGTATDYQTGCDDNEVAIVLSFTPGGGTARMLTVLKQRSGSLPGSYTGVLRDSTSILNRGTLVVSATSG